MNKPSWVPKVLWSWLFHEEPIVHSQHARLQAKPIQPAPKPMVASRYSPAPRQQRVAAQPSRVITPYPPPDQTNDSKAAQRQRAEEADDPPRRDDYERRRRDDESLTTWATVSIMASAPSPAYEGYSCPAPEPAPSPCPAPSPAYESYSCPAPEPAPSPAPAPSSWD